jgi:hypothetical protein
LRRRWRAPGAGAPQSKPRRGRGRRARVNKARPGARHPEAHIGRPCRRRGRLWRWRLAVRRGDLRSAHASLVHRWRVARCLRCLGPVPGRTASCAVPCGHGPCARAPMGAVAGWPLAGLRAARVEGRLPWRSVLCRRVAGAGGDGPFPAAPGSSAPAQGRVRSRRALARVLGAPPARARWCGGRPRPPWTRPASWPRSVP